MGNHGKHQYLNLLTHKTFKSTLRKQVININVFVNNLAYINTLKMKYIYAQGEKYIFSTFNSF